MSRITTYPGACTVVDLNVHKCTYSCIMKKDPRKQRDGWQSPRPLAHPPARCLFRDRAQPGRNFAPRSAYRHTYHHTVARWCSVCLAVPYWTCMARLQPRGLHHMEDHHGLVSEPVTPQSHVAPVQQMPHAQGLSQGRNGPMFI